MSDRDVHRKRYSSLARVLRDAHNQAAFGKGYERHATDENFEDQKIVVMTEWLKGSPAGGALFQAAKKIFESSRLSPEQAIHELRGAINYTSAAIIVLEREKANEDNE